MKRRAGRTRAIVAGTWPATCASHGRRLRAAIADNGCAPRGGARAPGRLPRGRRGPYGWEWLAAIRHCRVPEVPPLRRVGARLRPRPLQRLRVRAAGAVLVQRARLLPELRRAPPG